VIVSRGDVGKGRAWRPGDCGLVSAALATDPAYKFYMLGFLPCFAIPKHSAEIFSVNIYQGANGVAFGAMVSSAAVQHYVCRIGRCEVSSAVVIGKCAKLLRGAFAVFHDDGIGAKADSVIFEVD